MLSAALYARVRTPCAHCTRDRGCSAHPAFPAPSDFERREDYLQTSGDHRRENAVSWPSRLTEYFRACQGRPYRPEKLLEQETPAENDLTIKGKAYIAGIYEHQTRHAPDKSTAQLHAEVAKGAIEDAGLTKNDIDGYFMAGDAPGGTWPMVDYLGLNKVRHI